MPDSSSQSRDLGGSPTGASLQSALTARALWVFARADLPITARSAWRLIRTPIGVATLLLCVLASRAIGNVIAEGPFNPSGVRRPVVLGALAIAEIGAVLAFACRACAALAARLVIRFPHAPLRAHPALLTVAAWHQVIFGAIGAWAIASVVLVSVLNWHLLSVVLIGPVAWAYHTIALLGAMMIAGAAVVVFFRRTVLLAADVKRRAEVVVQVGLAGFLVFVYSAFGAETFLAERAPEVLASFGAGLLRLPPPLWVAVPGGLPAALCAGVIGLAFLIAIWRATARAAHELGRELPVDFASLDTSRAERLSCLVFGRGLFRLGTAFLAKDFLLPIARMPGLYVVRQWLTLSLTLTVLLAAAYGFPEIRSAAAPAIAPFVAAWYAALQAPSAALHVFGSEGRRLGWLRLRLGARILLLLKVAPATVVVAAHTLAATAITLLVMRLIGFAGVPWIATMLLAVAVAVVLTLYATGVAGLLTRYGASSNAPPAAGLGARIGYGLGVSVYLGLHGVLMFLMHIGALTPIVATITSLVFLALLLITSLVLGALVVRRLSILEFP